MELRRQLQHLTQHWRVVVLFVIAGVAAAMLAALTARPVYTSSAAAYVAVSAGSSIADISVGNQYSQSVANSLATVATTPSILDDVAQELKLGTGAELASKVTATVDQNTVVLQIVAEDSSPSRAAQIANLTVASLSRHIGDLTQTGDGSGAVRVRLVSPATAPVHPSSPNLTLNAIVGILAGLLLGLIAAAVIESLDTKVRRTDELEEITDSAVLGHVAFERRSEDDPLSLRSGTTNSRAESYRSIRAKMRFVLKPGEANVIVVTSSLPAEGKSSTSANLATALADTGQKVLLVDCDLRRPSIARYFGMDSSIGLTDVLTGAATLTDATQQWGGGVVDILPSGEIPPNPSELLGGERARGVFSEMRQKYDVVLLDTPPLLPVADAVVVSEHADGILLVYSERSTSRAQLAAAVHTIRAAKLRNMGVIVNKVRLTRSPIDGNYLTYAYKYDVGRA